MSPNDRPLPRLRAHLRYLDARWLRRHWCEACDRATVLEHSPHARPFDEVLDDEWRFR